MLNQKWIILQDTAMQVLGNSPWQHLVMNTGQFSIQGKNKISVGCLTCTWWQSCLSRNTSARASLQAEPGHQPLAVWGTALGQHPRSCIKANITKPTEELCVYPSSFFWPCTSQFCCFSPASLPAVSRSSDPLLPSFTSAFSVSNTFCPLMSRWITLCWCRWLKPWRMQRKVRGTQVQSMLFSDIPPQPIMLQKWKVHSWELSAPEHFCLSHAPNKHCPVSHAGRTCPARSLSIL